MSRGVYIVLRKGKRIVNPGPGSARVLPLVWTGAEVRALRKKHGCFTVMNLKTQKKFKAGASCPRKK